MKSSERDNIVGEEFLDVLRVIDTNPKLTQREISRSLGISLGKVNFILKALIQAGLVKALNFKNSSNKKAYLYIITTSGIKEKAMITYAFLKRKMEEYERLEEQIRLLKKEVGELEKASGTNTESIRKF